MLLEKERNREIYLKRIKANDDYINYLNKRKINSIYSKPNSVETISFEIQNEKITVVLMD